MSICIIQINYVWYMEVISMYYIYFEWYIIIAHIKRVSSDSFLLIFVCYILCSCQANHSEHLPFHICALSRSQAVMFLCPWIRCILKKLPLKQTARHWWVFTVCQVPVESGVTRLKSLRAVKSLTVSSGCDRSLSKNLDFQCLAFRASFKKPPKKKKKAGTALFSSCLVFSLHIYSWFTDSI